MPWEFRSLLDRRCGRPETMRVCATYRLAALSPMAMGSSRTPHSGSAGAIRSQNERRLKEERRVDVGGRLDAVIVVVGTVNDRLAPGPVGMTKAEYRAASGSVGDSWTPAGVVDLRNVGTKQIIGWLRAMETLRRALAA